MSGPNRGSPIYRKAYVDPETTFGTPATQYPVAADALRIIGGSVNVKVPSEARADSFGTATKNGAISMKETAEWSLEFYLYTPGTAATDPDWTDLLVNCCGLQRLAAAADSITVSGGSGHTTTTIDITNGDAANYTAGFSFVTVSGQTRRVTVANAAPSPDVLTLSPPLSAAPSDGVTVTGAISFYPDDDADLTPKGATIWIGNNAHLWRLVGCVATSISVSFPGDGAARCTVSGTARTGRLIYTTTMNDAGGINDVVASVTVTSDDIIPDDVSATNPYYLTISKGAATEEFVQVTAKAANVLTIVRGSPSGSGQTHADGVTMEPYAPAGTFAGNPIPATGGHDYMAGVLTQNESFSLEVETGILPREDVHGAGYKMADWIQGQRTATASADSWTINTPNMHRVRDALQRAGIEHFSQHGDTTGSIVAVVAPTVYDEAPDFSFDDSEVRITFSGECRGTVENEFLLASG